MVAHRYWDANVFLAWLKEEPEKLAQCEAGIRDAEAGKLVIVTSALTLAETLYLVRGEIPVAPETREKVRSFFRNEYILLHELDRGIAELAQDVVWDHEVAAKDAVHVATALTVGERLPLEQLDTYDGPLIAKSGTISRLKIGQPSFQVDLLSDAAAQSAS